MAGDACHAFAISGSTAHASDCDLQIEDVARNNLATETSFVDTSKQRKFSGKAFISQECNGTRLGEGFDHQHTGERGSARKMPGPKGFVTPEMPAAMRAYTGLDRHNVGDKQKRGTMGKDRCRIGTHQWRSHVAPVSANAASNEVGVSFGLILYQA